MTSIGGTPLRWIGACAAALAAFAFLLLFSASAPDARGEGTDCGPHVGSTPDEATIKELRRALACLINAERAERNRKHLRSNADLAGVAKRHTKVMLAEECFKHECPGERPLKARIEASGYLKAGDRYGYGENLGCSTTPAAMFHTWMTSSDRFHKKNILDRKFRHIGIGAKQGTPYPRGSVHCRPGRDHVTYTVIFGWRKHSG
jgi:uncharacterized protein YkwD